MQNLEQELKTQYASINLGTSPSDYASANYWRLIDKINTYARVSGNYSDLAYYFGDFMGFDHSE